ncbi:somatostatin receptor type 2-like [Styela clava]
MTEETLLFEDYLDDDLFSGNSSGIGEGGGINTPTSATTPPWGSIIARIIICVIGVFGNILVIIFIIALKEYRRAASHWYVLQLAIADLIFLLTLPFKISEDINDVWIFTSGMCKAKETVLFLNYYASIIFLTVMSVDRYVAVCHTYPPFMKKFKFTASVTVIVWIASLIMCIPIMMYSDVIGLHPTKCRCGYVFPKPMQTPEEWCVSKKFVSEEAFADCITWAPVGAEINKCKSLDTNSNVESSEIVSNLKEDPNSWGTLYEDDDLLYADDDITAEDDITTISCMTLEGIEWRAYVYFNFVIMFLVPFIVISLCYGMIGYRLKRTLMATSSRADRDRKKITAMCAVLVAIFVICWLPFHAVHVAKIRGINASIESNLCAVLPVITSLLAYLNAAINPYLYNFIGSFKKRFRQLIGRASITSSLSSRPKENSRKLSARSSVA